jgi:hypothetical protein
MAACCSMESTIACSFLGPPFSPLSLLVQKARTTRGTRVLGSARLSTVRVWEGRLVPPAAPRRLRLRVEFLAVDQEKSFRFRTGHGLGQNGLFVIVHWRGGAGPPRHLEWPPP